MVARASTRALPGDPMPSHVDIVLDRRLSRVVFEYVIIIFFYILGFTKLKQP
jgi:hypothetical protein